MKKYKVWVRLECEYDDIEAEDENDAFLKASDYAMGGGSWDWVVEEIDDMNEDFSGEHNDERLLS